MNKYSFLSLLEDLGLVWKYALNGLIGGFVWSLYKKSKFLDALRQILIGGIVSGYFTPVIVAKFEMDLSLTGFTSYVLGMLGMVIIDSLYKYVALNYNKWGYILRVLFTKGEVKQKEE